MTTKRKTRKVLSFILCIIMTVSIMSPSFSPIDFGVEAEAADATISITANTSGKTLDNKAGYLNMYLPSGTSDEDNSEAPMTGIIEYVEIMNATGGGIKPTEVKDSNGNVTGYQLKNSSGKVVRKYTTSETIPHDRDLIDLDGNFRTDMLKRLTDTIDGILNYGAAPLIKLGSVPFYFSPSGNYTVNGMYVNPYSPESDVSYTTKYYSAGTTKSGYEGYMYYLMDVIQYLITKYGIDEVRTWRWGVDSEYENYDWFHSSTETRTSNFNADEDNSNGVEANWLEFFQLYDWSVQAIINAFTANSATADDVYVGAHAMVCTPGLWDEKKFLDHIAGQYSTKNYADSSATSVDCDYIGISFYEYQTGTSENDVAYHNTKTFVEAIDSMRDYAEKLNLNLEWGVDEGRIYGSGSYAAGATNAQLQNRAVGYTWQAAYDAHIYAEMISEDIDYFCFWSLASGGQNKGFPTVSYHVAQKTAEMSGDTSYLSTVNSSATATGVGGTGFYDLDKTTADSNKKTVEINAYSTYNTSDSTMRIMAYNYEFSNTATASQTATLNVTLPEKFKGKTVYITEYKIDNDANAFDDWLTDINATGADKSKAFAWSWESQDFTTVLKGGNINYTTDDSDVKEARDTVINTTSSNMSKYAECAKLTPTSKSDTADENGTITINASMQANSAVYYEISLDNTANVAATKGGGDETTNKCYINVPECIYLTPSTAETADAQFILDQTMNKSTGTVTPNTGYKTVNDTFSTDDSGLIEFYCPGATNVRLCYDNAGTATIYNEAGTGKIGNCANMTDSNGDGTYTAYLQKATGVTNSSHTIDYKFCYQLNGVSYTKYAYTYVYKPLSGDGSTLAVGTLGRNNASSNACNANTTAWFYGVHEIVTTRRNEGTSDVIGSMGDTIDPTNVGTTCSERDTPSSGTISESKLCYKTTSIGYRGYYANDSEVYIVNYYEGNLWVDIDRCTNFNQIPNLIAGLDIHELYYNTKNTGDTKNAFSLGIYISGSTYSYTDANIITYTNNKYNSNQVKGKREYSTNISLDFSNQTGEYFEVIEHSYACSRIKPGQGDNIIRVYRVDKSALRTAIEKAQNIIDNSSLDVAYKGWASSDDFIYILKQAYIALGNPAASSSDVSTYTDNLNNFITAYQATDNSNRIASTATVKSVLKKGNTVDSTKILSTTNYAINKNTFTVYDKSYEGYNFTDATLDYNLFSLAGFKSDPCSTEIYSDAYLSGKSGDAGDITVSGDNLTVTVDETIASSGYTKNHYSSASNDDRYLVPVCPGAYYKLTYTGDSAALVFPTKYDLTGYTTKTDGGYSHLWNRNDIITVPNDVFYVGFRFSEGTYSNIKFVRCDASGNTLMPDGTAVPTGTTAVLEAYKSKAINAASVTYTLNYSAIPHTVTQSANGGTYNKLYLNGGISGQTFTNLDTYFDTVNVSTEDDGDISITGTAHAKSSGTNEVTTGSLPIRMDLTAGKKYYFSFKYSNAVCSTDLYFYTSGAAEPWRMASGGVSSEGKISCSYDSSTQIASGWFVAPTTGTYSFRFDQNITTGTSGTFNFALTDWRVTEEGDSTQIQQTKYIDDTATLDAQRPKRDGYVFQGYSVTGIDEDDVGVIWESGYTPYCKNNNGTSTLKYDVQKVTDSTGTFTRYKCYGTGDGNNYLYSYLSFPYGQDIAVGDTISISFDYRSSGAFKAMYRYNEYDATVVSGNQQMSASSEWTTCNCTVTATSLSDIDKGMCIWYNSNLKDTTVTKTISDPFYTLDLRNITVKITKSGETTENTIKTSFTVPNNNVTFNAIWDALPYCVGFDNEIDFDTMMTAINNKEIIDYDDNTVTVVSTDGERDYYSSSIQLTPGHKYVLKFNMTPLTLSSTNWTAGYYVGHFASAVTGSQEYGDSANYLVGKWGNFTTANCTVGTTQSCTSPEFTVTSAKPYIQLRLDAYTGAKVKYSNIAIVDVTNGVSYTGNNSVIVDYGSCCTVPTVSKAYYKLDGWYTGKNGTGTKVDVTQPWAIAEDTNLYSYWVPKEYTVEYDNLFNIKNLDTTIGTRVDSSSVDTENKTITYTNTSTDGNYQAFFGYWTGDLGSKFNVTAGHSYKVTYTLTNKGTTDGLKSTLTLFQFTAANADGDSYSGWKEVKIGWDADNNDGPLAAGESRTVTDTITVDSGITLLRLRFDTYKADSADAIAEFSNIRVEEVVDGYTVPATQSANYNTSVALASPSRTGYDFNGWYDNASLTGTAKAAGSSYTIPGSNTYLYSKFTAKTYTVTLNTTNENATSAGTASVTATYNSALGSVSTVATKTGYTLQGYYTSTGGNGSKIYNANGTAVSGVDGYTDANGNWIHDGGVTLYAHFTIDSHNAIFYANGSTCDTKSVNYGSAITAPSSNPSKTGYTFKGWKSGTADSTTPSDALTSLGNMGTSDVNFAAVWQINRSSVTINPAGGSVTVGTTAYTASRTFTQNYNTTLSIAVPTRTGYTFAGWTYTKASGNDSAMSSTTSAATYTFGSTNGTTDTLTATWTPNTNTKYTVEIYEMGTDGKYPSTATKFTEYTDGTTAASKTVATPTASQTYFTYDSSAANVATATIAADGSTVFKFYYKRAQYTLTLSQGTGTTLTAIAGTTTLADGAEVYHGVSITVTASANTGYKSLTLKKNGDAFTSGNSFTMTADTSLVTTATKITYEVTYDKNNGTGTVSSQTKVYGEALTLNTNSLTRTGYTAAGWNTSADGSGTNYANGASYTANAELKLYAKWTADTFTLAYDANGGDGAPNSQTLTYDSTGTISATAPTRDKYTFLGWSADSSATTATYASSASLEKATVNTMYSTSGVGKSGTYTLYAVWRANVTDVDPDNPTTPEGIVIDLDKNVADYLKNNGAGKTVEIVRIGGAINDSTTEADLLTKIYDSADKITTGDTNFTVTTEDDVVTSIKAYKTDSDGNHVLVTTTQTIYYCVKYTENSTTNYYYGKAAIVPASSVYYEEELFKYNSAETGDNATYKWNDKSVNPFKDMTAETFPNMPSEAEIAELQSTVNYTTGNSKWCMVDATAESNGKLSNATFKVTGTAVDIYGAANCYSGMLTVTVTPEGGTSTNYFTSLYYGYTYGQLYLNSKNELTLTADGNTPMYLVPTEGADKVSGKKAIAGSKEASTTATYYDGTKIVLGKTTDETNKPSAYAYGWVASATNSPSNGLYQAPVMHVELGGYGTYTVTITPRYSTWFDGGNNGFNLFYLDGVRVYDPLGDKETTSTNVSDESNTAYANNNEHSATYMSFPTMVKSLDLISVVDSDSKYKSNVDELTVTSTELFLKTTKADSNNVVGDTIVAKVTIPTTTATTKVSLGCRLVKGTTGELTVVCAGAGNNGQQITLNSKTESYVTLNGTFESGKTYNITIQNSSSGSAVVGLSNVKVSYNTTGLSTTISAAPSASVSASVGGSTDSTTGTVIGNTFGSAIGTITGNYYNSSSTVDISGVDVEWDKEAILKGEPTTITITAPTSIEKVIANGNEIPGYSEASDGKRTWTYTVTPDENGKYTIGLVYEDENGNTTEEKDVEVDKSNIESVLDITDITEIATLQPILDILSQFFTIIETILSPIFSIVKGSAF